jgi:hypothetical protein
MKENATSTTSRVLLVLVLGLLFLSIYFIPHASERTTGTSVKVTISRNKYKLDLSYEAAKTRRVTQYINECLSPTIDLQKDGKIDQKIVLGDSSVFYLKAYPGSLFLSADRRSNSKQFIKKLRQMTEGFKQIVMSN